MRWPAPLARTDRRDRRALFGGRGRRTARATSCCSSALPAGGPVSGSTSVSNPTGGSSASRGSQICATTTSCRVASDRSSRGQSLPSSRSETTTTSPRRRATRCVRWSASASDPAAVAFVRTRALLDVVQQREHGVATAAGRPHFGRRRRRSRPPRPGCPAREVRNPNAAAAASARSRFSQFGGPEVEARGPVDDEPGLELAVGDRVAHVRRVRARGQAPVDAAGVVAGLVQPGVAGFAARTAHVALVVAGQQPVELAVDEEIELPERASRSGRSRPCVTTRQRRRSARRRARPASG